MELPMDKPKYYYVPHLTKELVTVQRLDDGVEITILPKGTTMFISKEQFTENMLVPYTDKNRDRLDDVYGGYFAKPEDWNYEGNIATKLLLEQTKQAVICQVDNSRYFIDTTTRLALVVHVDGAYAYTADGNQYNYCKPVLDNTLLNLERYYVTTKNP